MKRFFGIVTILLFTSSMCPAQNEVAPVSASELHTSVLDSQQKPLPYPFLRESDVVWSTMIWKTIDLNELYNQYIYYPIDNPDPSGKKSLAYILWDAVAAGEIPIYEDDELKIPIDNETFVKRYTKPDTIELEIGYDDDDNEQYQTIIRPREFDGAEVYQYSLREAWFVGRQDTRQDSRRLALAPLKQSYHKFANTEEEIYLGNLPIFWVPMQNPHVRNLLARHTAYISDNNLVGQPSWDWIFVYQRYTAYITRESNIYSRSISHYLTGEDALDEADLIEEKLFDIENDLWDY
jgi:gliding motility associated protien GldN